MSPRPAGEADKSGNRYERVWTVAQLLDVLAGHVESIRIEPLGDVGKGVEFVLKRCDGSVEAHQVKRQSGNANKWNFNALKKLGIWDAAQHHSKAGREYYFVSMVPFQDLRELTERARNSNDFTSFIRDSLPPGSNDLFVQLGNLYSEGYALNCLSGLLESPDPGEDVECSLKMNE